MQALIEVILPVFLVMAAGYGATRAGWLQSEAIDGLMRFAQGVAVPCVLFLGVAQLDLARDIQLEPFLAFYTGAFACFILGCLGARFLFGRPGPDCVAIGFACLFSNTLLLGLPITERAYGPDALTTNYALIALHSPLMYAFGITAMEVVKSRGLGLAMPRVLRQIGLGLVTNPLIIGITAGFAVNIFQLPVPGVAWDAVTMIGTAGIPASLFGLGGVLTRYRPDGDLRIVAMVTGLSLILHPAITYGLGQGALGLTTPELRSATLTGAMPPGINAYLFANMYGVGKKVAATSVLIGTVLAVVTAWFWLGVLP
ncbi:AEC family transporter [Tabrizicola sp.]|uniref:AEC family transporter n=1 Tax=Tabrizicola sp. TaxID=2005166 RepID=UPI003F2A02C0